MRVAIVSPWAISKAAVGGTERFTVDLATGLARLGHTVTVFMLSGSDVDIDGVAYKSLHILGQGKIASEYDLQNMMGDFSNEVSFDRLARKMEDLLSLDAYDIVQINSLLFLKAWKEKKRIFTIHTNPFEYKFAWGKKAFDTTVKILGNEAIDKNTVLTAPSQHYSKIFARSIDCPVRFIPHAIDTRRLYCDISRSDLIYKYGLNSNKTTLLLPSRLEPLQKRPQILFKALTRLSKEKLDNLQVISAGLDAHYDIHRKKLAKLASTKNITARFVHFETIAEAYKLADIVVLPSCSESFGYSALESLSLNKITLLNNIPTFHELGDMNPNAYYFDKTADALSKLLNEVIDSNVQNVIAPKHWVKEYDLMLWAKKYEELF